MSCVTIESLHEVRALHRLLFKYKFVHRIDDEFFGSPFVANVQRTLFDSLLEAEGEKWLDWANAENHRMALAAVTDKLEEVSDDSWWLDADATTRSTYVRDLLAPLIVDDATVAELVGRSGDPSASRDP